MQFFTDNNPKGKGRRGSGADLEQEFRQPSAVQLVDNRTGNIAQGSRANVIDGSPKQMAQRQQLGAQFGNAIQLQAEEEELQMKMLSGVVQCNGSEDEALLQGKFSAEPVQQAPEVKANNTGLPDNLKAGVESLSGYSMDDVKVHYNSVKPAQLNAHAYAQGNEIHLGAGQEQHLPHEAWHVVQQAQGRVKPTLQEKGMRINDDRSLEHEADVMGAMANQSKGDNVQLKRPLNAATLSKGLMQRQAGIPAGTHVAVNDGGPVWYGQINSVDDTAGTYEVRVGGMDKMVQVPQAQVDYHEVVEAVSPVRVGMERWVDTLPVLNPAGDMAAFGGAGVRAQIVTAQGQMTNDAAVAEHTIAMFQYMNQHAAAIGGRINADFLLIPVNESVKRKSYLESMSACMTRKIQRGLWIGGDDKGMIAVDALDPVAYFREGRAQLILKATQALAANKTLVSLLENHSNNMSAKSYGRRQESMGVLNIAGLTGAGIDMTLPVVNTPVPHDRAGFVYYLEDYSAQVAANALVVNNSYVLYINNAVTVSVTVGANGPNSVTFSHVT